MIDISGVKKRFNGHLALDDITLRIKEGQCFGLIGRNGAGKTTLFRILCGLLRADGGRISYNDVPFSGKYKAGLKKKIGVVLDESLLIEEFSGMELLEFSARIYGVPDREIPIRIRTLLDFLFESQEPLTKQVSSYSTGMKKRIMLAAALLHRPQVLLLDEPLAGLDPISAGKVTNLLRRYATDHTVLLSSHDLSFVENCCSEIAIIEKGKLLFQGPTAEFSSLGGEILEESLYKVLLPKQASYGELNWLV